MRFTHAEQIRDLISAINRLASGRLCSPTPAQYAVRPALEGDRSFLVEFMRALKQRRDFVINAVNSIAGLSCVVPEAAFYVMLKAADPAGRTDERFVLDLLEATGALVVHGSGFGAEPQLCYFRLVYLAEENTLATVFQRLGGFLKQHHAARR
jgi:alanine-synthesizing transaminase